MGPVDFDKLFDKLDDGLDALDDGIDSFDDFLERSMDKLDKRLKGHVRTSIRRPTKVTINGKDVTEEWIRKGKIKNDGSTISISSKTKSDIGFVMSMVSHVIKWIVMIAMGFILWWFIQYALTPQVSKNPSPMNPPAVEDSAPVDQPKAL